MRIEKSVTSITWIPSEAISGMPKLPFEMGVAHYDAPPPDKLEDLETLREADAFRVANELRASVEVDDGKVVEKSGTIDFGEWYKTSHGKNTPWGEEDSPALTTAVESDLERQLSASIMREGKKLERRNLEQGHALMNEGEEGRELFLLLDGIVDIEVNGDPVAEIGPGALLGERALLEGGKRTATVWAKTPIRVAVVPADAIDEAALPELAASHRREG